MDERGRNETGRWYEGIREGGRGGERMVAVIQRQTEQGRGERNWEGERGRAREDGRKRTEERGRKREDGRKRTEERGRAREDGRKRTEERGRKREDGRERTEERGQ